MLKIEFKTDPETSEVVAYFRGREVARGHDPDKVRVEAKRAMDAEVVASGNQTTYPPSGED